MISDWVKPPEIISALIASFGGRETRSERYNVLVLHKSYKLLCDSREQFFKNYIPGSQKFTLLIHQNVHLNLLRCRCKNSKRFLNFRPPQLPRRSSANSVYMQNAWAFAETLQLRDRGCTYVFPRQKELYACCFDDEVPSSKRRGSLFTWNTLGRFHSITDHFSRYWMYWLFMNFWLPGI